MLPVSTLSTTFPAVSCPFMHSFIHSLIHSNVQLSETYSELAVIEDLVEGSAEEVRDTVILEYVVNWSLHTAPDAERARVLTIDAETTAEPIVLVI